jgi:hypothetical protein
MRLEQDSNGLFPHESKMKMMTIMGS